MSSSPTNLSSTTYSIVEASLGRSGGPNGTIAVAAAVAIAVLVSLLE